MEHNNNPMDTIDPFDAALVAQFMRDGLSKTEAMEKVFGGAPGPVENDVVVEDVEPQIIPQKSKDLSDSQVALHERLQNLDESEIFEVTLKAPAYIYEWLGRKTLQEAFIRNNPNFLEPDFLLLMLKEQRAIDPTKAGTVTSTSSGPKDLYNPHTEKWS